MTREQILDKLFELAEKYAEAKNDLNETKAAEIQKEMEATQRGLDALEN